MDLQKKREEIMAEINRCKGSIFDHQQEIEQIENRLYGLHGALETLEMLSKEKQ